MRQVTVYNIHHELLFKDWIDPNSFVEDSVNFGYKTSDGRIVKIFNHAVSMVVFEKEEEDGTVSHEG